MIAQFRGKVIEGKKRGKKLGFPTANVTIPKGIPEGIYLSLTFLESKEYPSLTFIGSAKTFAETDFQAETYILNFDKDIYGEAIAVKLVRKIRDNKKFDSAEALVKQMQHDTMTAEKFFAKEGLL